MKYFSVIASVLTLLFLAACSGTSTSPPPSRTTAPASGATPSGSGSGSAGGQAVTVNMTDAYQFAPAAISIKAGTTVTWVNTGQQPHTSTDDPTKAINPSNSALPSGAEAWDSGLLNAGQSYSHTFTTPGQYTYFCIPHEALGMVARVVVTP